MRSGHKKSAKLGCFPLSVVVVQREVSQAHAMREHSAFSSLHYLLIAKFSDSKEKSPCFLVCLTCARAAPVRRRQNFYALMLDNRA
jgi:hypothetical protein